MLAYELKRPVHEIEEMSPDEYATWISFFDIKQERMSKASKTSRPNNRRRGLKGR